jgi:hypothetical protein
MPPSNAVFLFVTKGGTCVWSSDGYKYDDRVFYENGVMYMDFVSQKRWKVNDVHLLNNDNNTFVFLRESGVEPFRYIGRVRERNVRAQRSASSPLVMRFRMETQSTSWCTCNQVFPPMPFTGHGKYKMGVYDVTRAVPLKGNGLISGIVPVRFRP